MNDPEKPERQEKNLNGVDERLDNMRKPAVFRPYHCELCGQKALEYTHIRGVTSCLSCVSSEDRMILRRKK